MASVNNVCEGASSTRSSKLAAVLEKLHSTTTDSAAASPGMLTTSSKPNSPLSPDQLAASSTACSPDSGNDGLSPGGNAQVEEQVSADQCADCSVVTAMHLIPECSETQTDAGEVDMLADSGQSSISSKPTDPVAEPSRSSRRKQQKTRKVAATASSVVLGESDENYLDAYLAEYSSTLHDDLNDALSLLQPLSSSPPISPTKSQTVSISPASRVSRRSVSSDRKSLSGDASSPADVKEDRFILPEGTVFVQPESVDSSPVFHEIESSRTKGKFKGNLDTAIINCTACNRQIGSDTNTDVQRHPVLKVLICKKCHKLYSSANIEMDADGSDEQCRWCCQGGDLICCDYCHNAICKTCIRRNLGRKELNTILSAGDGERWRCYVCDPKPLLGLIEHCTSVMEALARQEKQESERRRKTTADSSNKTASAASTTAKIPASAAAGSGKTPIFTSSAGKTQASGAASNSGKTTAVAVASSGKTPIFTSSAGKTQAAAANNIGKTVALASGGKTAASVVSNAKTSLSSQLTAQPVSVIQSTAGRVKNRVADKMPPAKATVRMTTPAPTAAQSLSAVARQPSLGQPSHVVGTIAQSQGLSRPANAPLHAVLNANNVVGVLDRLISATNSMHVFLQSLRADAKRVSTSAVTVAVQFEKRREIAGKLARAYSAYARSFAEAASQCNSAAVQRQQQAAGMQPPRPTGPRASAVSPPAVQPQATPAGVVHPTGASATAVRPVGMPQRNRHSVVQPPPSTAAAKSRSVSGDVIELSDSDDEHGSGTGNSKKSQQRSIVTSTHCVVPVVSAKRPGTRSGEDSNSLSPAAATKGDATATTMTRKRSHSPDSPTGPMPISVSSLVKRGRRSNTKTTSAAATTDQDSSMFDGGVDEIPADDHNSSSEEHHLQMFCVEEVNDNGDDEDDSSEKPKVIELTNGTKTISSTKCEIVEDCNRNEASVLKVETVAAVVSESPDVKSS